MMKELVQLHWEYPDGKTELKAQREISNVLEMRKFIQETVKEFTKPSTIKWKAALEEDPAFIYMETAFLADVEKAVNKSILK